MLTTKPIISVKDSTTFTLSASDLWSKQVGDNVLTSKRDVPCSDGLQWWIQYYPTGNRNTSIGHVSVYLYVNKPVNAKYTFAVDGTYIGDNFTHEFTSSPDCWGSPKFASHEQLLRRLSPDGQLTFTCRVELEILPPLTVPPNYQLFRHIPTDVQFAIGSERVPAHKYFLLLISPVFQAMFTHDTAESKSGVIDIEEFDFETVKTPIDICYGRESRNLHVETVVGILRFCDKYFITAVIDELEKLPLLDPSAENFYTVLQYAYDCNRDHMLTTCYNYFKEHQDEIKATEKFAQLPPTLVITVIKSAFELKTDLEVLCHAKNNDIDFVVSQLEKSLIEPITLDNFCAVVTYAWNCSLDELQQSCAKFLNEHRDEVMELEAIQNLPSDVFANVFKASYVLKRRQEII